MPFVTGYASSDVVQTHREFATTLAEVRAFNAWAARKGQPQLLALETRLQQAYAIFNRNLDRAATIGAQAAARGMKGVLKQTQLRPDTDRKPHLRELLHSKPAVIPGLRGFATGSVAIGDIDQLEKAIDPDFPQHGSYWRAQNYGTTAHVGREIHGFFHGPGGSMSRPLAALAGGGTMQHDPMFSPSSKISGPRGGGGGRGMIRVPLKPRHFIERGRDAGYGEWLAAMALAEQDALLSITRAMGTALPGVRGTGMARRRRR